MHLNARTNLALTTTKRNCFKQAKDGTYHLDEKEIMDAHHIRKTNTGRQCNLVDTGANIMVSKHRSDFSSFTDRKIPVNTTSGEILLVEGILHENRLGYTTGLYHEKLTLDRILPFLSQDVEPYLVLWLDTDWGQIINKNTGDHLWIEYDQSLPFLHDDMWDMKFGYRTTQARVHGTVKWVHPKYGILLNHQRLGHWHTPGVKCAACELTKGSRSSHAKTRPEHRIFRPLENFVGDYCGPFPPSTRGRHTLFVLVEDSTGYPFAIPLTTKADLKEVLQAKILQIRKRFHIDDYKVFRYFRTDNEPVLHTPQLQEVFDDCGVVSNPGVPYNPQHQGVAERWVRSLVTGLRTVLQNVDVRLWDYAAVFLSKTYAVIPKDTYPRLVDENWKGYAPMQILEWKTTGKCPEIHLIQDRFKRFGCLAYYRDECQITGKLTLRWRRGVYLGPTEKSSGHLIGTWVPDRRYKTGVRWAVQETMDVRFHENILIGNIDTLHKERELSVKYDILDQMVDGAVPASGSIGCEEAMARLLRPTCATKGESVAPPKDKKIPDYMGTGLPKTMIFSDDEVSSENDTQPPPAKRARIADETHGPTVSATSHASCSSRPSRKESIRGHTESQPSKTEIVLNRQERRRLTKEQLRLRKSRLGYLNDGDGYEPGDEIQEVHIYNTQMTMKQAMASPDKDEWEKAISKEHARLLMYKTWREASPEDMKDKSKQILPVAIILTRKRDKSFKARGVVVGCVERADQDLEIYSPVISQVGCRILLTDAARAKDKMIAFDLDSAFLNARIERDVFIRLPKIWDKEQTVKKLQRAMYGLRDAPRAWYHEYQRHLKKLGWRENIRHKGLWSKPSLHRDAHGNAGILKLAVYVDDNVMTGPSHAELRDELKGINELCSGREIPSEDYQDENHKWWKRMDFLGGDLLYSESRGEFKITMERYIMKLAKKFGISCTRPMNTPSFNETPLAEGEKGHEVVDKFPFRSILGGLIWVTTVARPDVAVPTSVLAKYATVKCTKPMVAAMRKVVKYLITTKDQGIGYSEQQEQKFDEIYYDLLPDDRKKGWMPRTNWFSDASFANDLRSLRSTSGSIAYYYSCPIIWKTKCQSIRTYSTCESEYVACSDTLVIAENIGPLSIYDDLPTKQVEIDENTQTRELDDDAIIWLDSASAIAAARNTSQGDTRPKSRHFALRWMRVSDNIKNLSFCPTTLQRADGLSKLTLAKSQRDLLMSLHQVSLHQQESKEKESHEYSDSETNYRAFLTATVPARLFDVTQIVY